jgi:gas vesicle protein
MANYKLREDLITRISQIDDENTLNRLKDLLETGPSGNVLRMTREQSEEIKSSISDILEGSYIENRIFKKQVRSWLKGR